MIASNVFKSRFRNRLSDALLRRINQWRLKRLRRRMFHAPSGLSSLERFGGYRLRILDGPDFYIQYKDFFIRQIYRFDCQRPDPLIIDGGSNIGMSLLYFKKLYPQSRIIGFEPDPEIFKVLQENIELNHLTHVTRINAGLGARKEKHRFIPDGKSAGRLADGRGEMEVQVERLSDYLDEPVDFLKLNIEGAEMSVLRETAEAGKLKNVRETVIEYHGWPDIGQSLGELLSLLDQQGFRYLVHDFDSETCQSSKPPFHLTKETKWFCLIYAKRLAP